MSDDQINRISWIVIWTMIAALSVVAILDLWLIRYQPGGPTVSSTVWHLAREYPVVVLIVGIVLGHLFWPQH